MSFLHWSLITGFVTRITQWVHEFIPSVSEVRVARSLVFCVVFCRFACPLSFRPLHCLSWFPLRYLSTFLKIVLLEQSAHTLQTLINGYYILEVSNLPISTILLLDFGIVPTVWHVILLSITSITIIMIFD